MQRTSVAVEVLGDLEERVGHYKEAATLYEECLTMKPLEYEPWASLGGVYRKLGRNADAQSAYSKGLKRAEAGISENRRDAERVAWCAFYLVKLGKAKEGRERAAEALQIAGPDRPKGGARKRLILTYGQLHDVDAALRLLEGTPNNLVKELLNNPELSNDLRRVPRFQVLQTKGRIQ